MDGIDSRLLKSILPGITLLLGLMALIGTWTNGVSYALGSQQAFSLPLTAVVAVVGTAASILTIKLSGTKLAHIWA
jgi:hypothetical protein